LNLETATDYLRNIGQKITPQRLAILKLLIDQSKPLSADEVYSNVRSTHPHISLDTFYRNLSLLANSGLVSQVNLQNREKSKFEFQGQSHHHHAVCLECGKSFCVDYCPPRSRDLQPKEDDGFEVIGHAFEVYGYCSGCASAKPAMKNGHHHNHVLAHAH
jgi:Fur family zinc uptake transcriptional regulator